MNKKQYIAPSVEVIRLNSQSTLLAGSYETTSFGEDAGDKDEADARLFRSESIWDSE